MSFYHWKIRKKRMARQIKMLKNGEWVTWDHSDVNFLLIEEKITFSEFKKRYPKIYLNIRIKDGVRQLHKSSRELSESEVKIIPDRYWDDDLPEAGGNLIGSPTDISTGSGKTSVKFKKK